MGDLTSATLTILPSWIESGSETLVIVHHGCFSSLTPPPPQVREWALNNGWSYVVLQKLKFFFWIRIQVSFQSGSHPDLKRWSFLAGEGMGPDHEDFVWEICRPILELGPELVVGVLYWRAVESLATTKVPSQLQIWIMLIFRSDLRIQLL